MSYKTTKKVLFLWKYTFFHSILLNKIVLEWAIYPTETWKVEWDDVWNSPPKIGCSTKPQKKILSFWRHIFLHWTPLNRIVLEWANYPKDTMKSRNGWCPELSSKNWVSPTKPQKSATSLKLHIFTRHTPK